MRVLRLGPDALVLMVDGRGIEPHVKLMDKSERTDGALSRSDFAFNPEGNATPGCAEAL